MTFHSSRRRLFAAAAGLAVGLGAVSAPIALADPPARTLTVMSYNIHAGAGADNVYSLDRIAEVIRSSGADVVALQEVDRHWGARSNFEDTAAILGAKLGMSNFVAPIYSFDPLTPDAPRREYGVGILSRYPILSATNHPLTRLSTQDANPVPAPAPGFAEAVINVRGVHVHVYSTHLDYRGDPTVRRLQVADTLAVLGADSGPKILMGDMNAVPSAPELAPLRAAYVDVWDAVGDGRGATFPTDPATKRIDQILVSPEVTAVSAAVLQTQASDHLPVVATVTVRRR